jgi:mannose-6-phosphate isomerase-like protein (cupin superfamily)
MSGYSVVKREDAFDFMKQYPGFGEMRMFTDDLGAEQVAFTWRSMPEDTGGRGSYGHSHKTQEEIYFVVSGTLTFKLGDDVFEAGPGTAVRIAPDVVRSVHNDGPGEVELIICSPKLDDPAADPEQVEDFWPSD